MNRPLLVRDKNAVVFIMGPTASGKTDAAIELARHYSIAVINADAAQVYRHMDIGTAKPSAQELSKTPHRLIDFIDPAEPYSAAAFRQDALCEIEQIHAVNKTPVLVGGSMFYFKALERGLSELPEADHEIRSRIELEAKHCGWAALHRQLAEIDPQAALKIDVNDPQRIQRALEIYQASGKPPTQVFKQSRLKPMPYRAIKIVIAPYSRVELHKIIEQRFMRMLDCGLIEEVAQLKQRDDLSLDIPSMRTVGYRQVWEFLDGLYSRRLMIEKAVAATRQLAKRQLTWLRNQSGLVWFVGYNSTEQSSLHKYFAN